MHFNTSEVKCQHKKFTEVQHYNILKHFWTDKYNFKINYQKCQYVFYPFSRVCILNLQITVYKRLPPEHYHRCLVEKEHITYVNNYTRLTLYDN